MSDLNARLLKAHRDDDKTALVSLYSEAADSARDEDAQAFFLTHAYVFALETNHSDTAALKSQLTAMKRA